MKRKCSVCGREFEVRGFAGIVRCHDCVRLVSAKQSIDRARGDLKMSRYSNNDIEELADDLFKKVESILNDLEGVKEITEERICPDCGGRQKKQPIWNESKDLWRTALVCTSVECSRIDVIEDKER